MKTTNASKKLKNNLKKTLPIFILALLVCVYFFKIIFFKNIFLTGDLYYYYSLRAIISNSLQSFHLPIWTQYLNCGFPLMANPEAGMFDPLNIILLYFFDPVIAFNTLICCYFFMAGLFMFLFCRSLELDSYSSLFSAIVFIFGGAFAGRLIHITMICSATFLPLIFWTINLFFKKKKLKFIFLIGLEMGASFLPGHPQIAVYIILVAMFYFLYNAIFIEKINFKLDTVKKYGILIILILITAIGISAMQNLPTKELTGLTTRSNGMRYVDARNISLDFNHFITYIFPFFFGFPHQVAGKVGYWGKGSFWELSIYLGIIPLCLFFAVFYRLKDKRVLFFLFLTLFSLLAALGKKTFFFFILFYLIPPLRYFKDPCRFVFISSFAMAILAGLGLSFISSDNDLIKRLFKFIKKAFFIILGVTVVFNIVFYFLKDLIIHGSHKVYLGFKGLSLNDIYVQMPFVFFISLMIILWAKKVGKIQKTLFFGLIIFITIIDLFILNFSHNIPQDSSIVKLSPQSVNFLKQDNSMFRVYQIGPDFPYGTDKQDGRDKVPFFVNWGVPSANVAGPLLIKGYFNAYSNIYNSYFNKTDINLNDDVFSLCNVKYFTSAIKLAKEKDKLVFDDGVVAVYKNPKFTPRIYFLNPSRSAYDYNSDIKVLKYLDNELSLEFKNKNPGFLVVSDTFYPGWKAFIDGNESKIVRINSIMRSVFVKSGAHRISFLYDPISLRLGVSISFISLLIILLICASKIGERKVI